MIGSAEWKDVDLGYPGGALASARYSIARRCNSFLTRKFLLDAALADLARSLADGPEDTAGLLLIRGSVFRQKGAFWAAVRDYEAAVKYHQATHASDEEMGIALSELGFGRLFQFRFFSGRSLLEEGVSLLSKANGRSGFLIRAQRKLSVAYALTGRVRDARALVKATRASASEHMALDQFR
jgi:tetratricopeptide (TPR) repeat protein